MCERILCYVAELLAHTERVAFLANHGFHGREWAKLCAALYWRYMIRLANTTLITFADGRQVALDQLGIKPGRRYFTNVRLTQEADWRCHLAITWTTPKPGEPVELCVVMTNWVPSKWVLKHYLRRMHVEESFRDEKSGSFDLHHSHLRGPQRLDYLLLAIAVAVLWIYELGEKVLRRTNGPISTQPMSDNSASSNSDGEHYDKPFLVQAYRPVPSVFGPFASLPFTEVPEPRYPTHLMAL